MQENETQTEKALRWKRAKEIYDSLSDEKKESMKRDVLGDPIDFLLLIVR